MKLAAPALICVLGLSACKKSEPNQQAPAKLETAAPPSASAPSAAAGGDVFATERGELRVVPIRHATLRLELGKQMIYVDPQGADKIADTPKADLILITDIHPDHFDPAAIAKIRQPATHIIAPPVVAEKLPGAMVMKNGETRDLGGISLTAVPMYNLKRGPDAGMLYHDKGRGNGYVLDLGGKRVYISGDTECTDEMRALKNIDIAFVCMNLPYTMPPEEALECIKAFKPKVVYPYHYRGSDLTVLTAAPIPGVEVRRREWYPEGG